MSIHVPVLSEHHEHNKATRAILFRPPAAVETKQEKRIRELEAMNRDLHQQVERKDIEIRRLSIDLSDRDARVLDQAHKLCQLLRIEEPEEEHVEVRRVQDIVDEVLQDYPGITMRDIVSVRRTRDLIVPRHRCYYEVFRQRPDLSFPAIGRYFKRDHTSILSAVKKHKTGEERK